jgi:hypothetical protein
LFAHLDTDIKTALTTLKTAQSVPQLSLENFDQYYNGDVARWIKAGNALRLKIAMRVLKRDQGKAMPIINEVLSESPDFLMSSNTDGWVFKASSGFTSGGNWNPDALYATKPLVDFMWDKQDPRLDVFFSPNGYTTENIKALINEGELPNGTTEPARRYLGSFTSPDESKANVNEKYYEARIATIDGQDVRVDTLSLIQRRLFQPSFNEGKGAGEGAVYFPVISYAEFCFMRAELAARSLTSDDAETFYNTGVTSSIQWYDQAAKDAKLSNYTELKPDEIADYLAMPEVAFDPAKALDQIASQAYLNFFKQPQEGWALWKRTGLPNTTTVLALTDMKSGGASLAIPRRAPLSLVSENDTNFTNKKAAYDAMAQDSGFGAGPSDAFGRVWWDN